MFLIGLPILKGHSHPWDQADLDTSFATLKSIYLKPKSNVHQIQGEICFNYLAHCFIRSFLFLLLKNLLLSFFYSFYHIILSSLVKNSMNSISCYTQISYEMVPDVHVHQLADQVLSKTCLESVSLLIIIWATFNLFITEKLSSSSDGW